MLLSEFNVRPSKRARLYYTVKVFDTVKAMHKYAESRPGGMGYKPKSGTVVGLCTTALRVNKNNKMLPKCGEVLLCKTDLNFRVVVHEIAHAMYGIKRRRNIGDLSIDKQGNVNALNEEWAVDAIGQMTETVYSTLLNQGVL